MLTRHVAIISQTKHVDFGTLTEVSAAIQKQVTRDFGPLWGIDATVDAFATTDAAPIDYWRVLIRDDIERPDEVGFHTTRLNQPVAFVQFDDDWSITASHETLEMLADPHGNSLVAGVSVQQGQGRVQYLQEICDPCTGANYQVNGVNVSDFCTPRFYDPVPAAAARYSFTDAIPGPRRILKGGYLSFIDPVTGHVFQQRWLEGTKPIVVDLSASQETADAMLRPGESLREMVDRNTPRPRRRSKPTKKMREAKRRDEAARLAYARDLQLYIDSILRKDA
jgi:hypothetical protein